MTKLSDKVKTALDETRMLILGVQILVGFQFRIVFEDAFDHLPLQVRRFNGLGLGFMVAALALLIAPGVYHRIVEKSEDSTRLHRYTSTMAFLALFPFSCGIGIDVFITSQQVMPYQAAIAAGLGFGGLALLFWYGIEALRRRTIGRQERRMARQRPERTEAVPLHTRIEQMLTEARVILPGAQALLGFQLIIAITQSFERLNEAAKLLHVASLGLVTLAVILLMAPAAYHRIVYLGEDSEEFHRTGSIFVTAATLPLALGLSCDLYVVCQKIFSSPTIGLCIAAGAMTGFTALWYVYPIVVRRHVAGG
jgi:hypothetical protein